MSKITLTRLLNEIKLANSKIAKKLGEDVKYFDVMTAGKLKYNKSEQDMKTLVESHLQSIKDLISLRDKYKSLLLNANNTTTVTVKGKTYTISEAIAKKDVIKQEQELVKIIRRQLQNAELIVQNNENTTESKLDDLIKVTMGKDRKAEASEIESLSKMFRESNKTSLVDAGGAKKFLEEKESEIEEFLNEIDFTLSEINSKTEVEVG